MKVTVYDPTNGRRIGLTSLRKDIAPGYLSVAGFRPGTYLGAPVMRTRTFGAHDTREAFRKLRFWIELTGWSVKVETTSAQARALVSGGLVSTTAGTYWLKHTGQRVVSQ